MLILTFPLKWGLLTLTFWFSFLGNLADFAIFWVEMGDYWVLLGKFLRMA